MEILSLPVEMLGLQGKAEMISQPFLSYYSRTCLALCYYVVYVYKEYQAWVVYNLQDPRL